jgi:hypothetical protein
MYAAPFQGEWQEYCTTNKATPADYLTTGADYRRYRFTESMHFYVLAFSKLSNR